MKQLLKRLASNRTNYNRVTTICLLVGVGAALSYEYISNFGWLLYAIAGLAGAIAVLLFFYRRIVVNRRSDALQSKTDRLPWDVACNYMYMQFVRSIKINDGFSMDDLCVLRSQWRITEFPKTHHWGALVATGYPTLIFGNNDLFVRFIPWRRPQNQRVPSWNRQ